MKLTKDKMVFPDRMEGKYDEYFYEMCPKTFAREVSSVGYLQGSWLSTGTSYIYHIQQTAVVVRTK